MDNTRLNKINRLIQKELSDIFQREARNLFKGSMISVTVVRTTADLSIARSYISIFPTNNSEEIFSLIEGHKRYLKNLLAQRIKNQVRKIPEPEFYVDDSLDYAQRIDDLLK